MKKEEKREVLADFNNEGLLTLAMLSRNQLFTREEGAALSTTKELAEDLLLIQQEMERRKAK